MRSLQNNVLEIVLLRFYYIRYKRIFKQNLLNVYSSEQKPIQTHFHAIMQRTELSHRMTFIVILHL